MPFSSCNTYGSIILLEYFDTEAKRKLNTGIVLLRYSSLLLLLFVFRIENALAEDLMQWERFRLKADLSIAEFYSDNIYLDYTNIQDDFFTRISPALNLKTALTENARIGFSYTGVFDYYCNADNFRFDNHFGDINFEIDSPKGSLFQVGVKVEDSAKQPFSESDQSKDYLSTEFYSGLDWKLNPITTLGAGYEHIFRRFDERRYQRDDYVKNNFNLSVLVIRNKKLPWLTEYRHEQQKNDNMQPDPTELIYQAVLTGFSFRPERRLSGTLEFGYFWTEFNDQDTFDGWMTDTDLKYRIGGFSDISLTAQRGVEVSDRVARDTLDYYIYAGIGVIFGYHRFAPLQLFFEATYQNRDYRLVGSPSSGRDDDLYRIALRSGYQLREWLTLSLDYSYRSNRSDQAIQEYDENLFMIEATISI